MAGTWESPAIGPAPLTGWSLWEEWESDPPAGGGGALSDGDYGDVIVSGGGTVMTLDGVGVVQVTVDFGASFAPTASEVVTGQAWITAATRLVATPAVASAVEAWEVGMLGLIASIHDVVVGDGFTLSVFSPATAKGTYTFNVVGVT